MFCSEIVEHRLHQRDQAFDANDISHTEYAVALSVNDGEGFFDIFHGADSFQQQLACLIQHGGYHPETHISIAFTDAVRLVVNQPGEDLHLLVHLF